MRKLILFIYQRQYINPSFNSNENQENIHNDLISSMQFTINIMSQPLQQHKQPHCRQQSDQKKEMPMQNNNEERQAVPASSNKQNGDKSEASQRINEEKSEEKKEQMTIGDNFQNKNQLGIQGGNNEGITGPVYEKPESIPLPWPKVNPMMSGSEVEAIIPCTMKRNEDNTLTLKRKTEQSMLDSRMSFQKEDMERSKMMTGILLEKIGHLEEKVKELQVQKAHFEQKLNSTSNLAEQPLQYQSTPQSPTKVGSIRRNNESIKNFNTVAETNETNNKNFRVRSINSNVESNQAKSNSSSINKIHSNIYSMTVIQSSNQNSLKGQINFLKEKLLEMQKQQQQIYYNAENQERQRQNKLNKESKVSLRDSQASQRSAKSCKSKKSLKVHDENKKQEELRKIYGLKHQEMQRDKEKQQILIRTPKNEEFKGKIVKRDISMMSNSPNNSFRSVGDGESIMPTPKGFIRSDPRKGANSVPPTYSQIDHHDSSAFHRESQIIEKPKIQRADSSAIFRKNPGPAIQREQSAKQHGFGTLEFNPEKQKFIIVDSKSSQMFFMENQNSNKRKHNQQGGRSGEISDIELPELTPAPTPQSTSEELIQIGKLALRKFGCEITDNTLLNVRKYKNCVYFSISSEENILWNYEGKFYYGGWKTFHNGEGEKSGEGVEYCPGKYKFKGYFAEGKKNGYGVMITDSGTVYQGQWEDGAKHGAGRQENEDGVVYEGEWKNGKRSGFGKVFNKGKIQFQGLFLKGLKSGHGKQYFDNGDYFQGMYLQNKFQGKGTYCWDNGAVYVGEFTNGQRNGHGVWKANGEEGDIYQGEYKDDLKEGFGVYRWKNGAVYEGQFKNDLKHGEGTIVYENGKVAHLLWNKGEAQKKVEMNTRKGFQTPSNTRKEYHKQTPPPSSNTITPQRNPHRNGSRSVQNLQSAKSISTIGQRSMPRGISTKKAIQTRVNNNQNGDLIKLKISEDLKDIAPARSVSRFKNQSQSRGLPKDPPYRGMQMCTNPTMNF